MKLDQVLVDHLWKMYLQGQASADHTHKQVFAEMLESFAAWQHNKTVQECMDWVDCSYSLWSNGDPKQTLVFANFTKRQLEALKDHGTTRDGLPVPQAYVEGDPGPKKEE
jgi:hypothetical protein